MKQPSTDWREDIAADEAERFQAYADRFIEIQKQNSAKFGNGRGLHRKQLLALKANFEVLSDLPPYAKQGLFAKPAKYDAWIRLSNGGMRVQSDSAPDIRGFALKVRGLNGPGALGSTTDHQDFLMINLPAFSSPKSKEFVELVSALAKGPLAVLGHLFGKYGFSGALKRMKKAKESFGKPFSGFSTEKFYTAAPLKCGPYACRVRMLPASSQPDPSAKENWAADVKRRVANGDLVHEFQLQFFVDEQTTPVEDASVDWPESEAPYVTVARLTIPKQSVEGPDFEKFQTEVETSAFDPWGALEDHRPLGDVMRARKYVYFASQKTRGAAG